MAEDPESGGEKTEDPSSRKLTKSREEGQVAKSIEIPSVFVLLTGAIALYFSASLIYNNLVIILEYNLKFDKIPLLTHVQVIHLLAYHTQKIILMCIPVMLTIFVFALISNFAQVGFSVSWQSLEPKFSRLDPINGFRQKFTSRAVVEFLKTLIKVAVISMVAYKAIKAETFNITTLYDNSVGFILLYLLKVSFWIFVKVCLIMFVVAILDYAYQRWKFLEEQKMTKKEVRDEAKQMEGDPLVKSRIRQLQHQAARKRMMADVPHADVVVTNPTHLAVALKYDGKTMDAPKILAKGAGPIAENIKRIAKENNVPLVEDKQLARNLYRTVDIGEEVPMELYQAVAELLAYVYKLRGKKL